MEKSTWIVCGKLFDGIRAELREKQEILITGSTIRQVGQNLSRPADAEILDLSHLTVTPGMIDAHVHGNLLRWQEMDHILHQSEAYSALAFLHTAQRCLERGFTTIRCHAMGPLDFGLADVKRLIDRGYFPGARLHIACHMLGGPGMPGDMSLYAATNPRLARHMQSAFVGSGADFFRDAVRREVKYGSDFIKIFLSGSFGSPDGGPECCYLDEEELNAIIRTAHDLKKPATAHVYPPAAMQRLLRLGIDGMEHGALIDEETAAMLECAGVFLVPTFSAYQDIIEDNETELARNTADEQAKKREWAPALRRSRQIICKSGIRLGFGSDFCVRHQAYESWYEYRSWLNSGMDPFRTLQAATMVNAGILGLERLIGSIEAGKQADIAAWQRDLLTDPDALRECAFVMKGGVSYPTGNKVVDCL